MMDPKEVELVAMVNQKTPEEIQKEIGQLEKLRLEKEREKEREREREKEAETELIEKKVVEEHEELLQPGTKIRPAIIIEDAIRLAERLYGIATKEIKELISYDDRNFLIQVDSNIKNPIIPNTWPNGYVLKVVNTLDSKKTNFVDGQTQMLLFLRQQNIICPRPVMNIYGKYYSVEELGDTKHIVRLLEYQPGKIFHEIPKTQHLFYQAGEFIGRLDKALKHFQHDAYQKHRSLWMLENVPEIEKFSFELKDEEKREIVDQVIVAFKKNVLNHLGTFEKGIIHGDFNEQNILVANVSPDDYRVSGILDFGDTCYSCYVFELAISMAYMMLQSEDLLTGGIVIAGYSMIRTIPERERKVLKVCVAARLCQSLVLGAYSHSLDPKNDYLLSTQKVGWTLLKSIWSQTDDELEELWMATADNYLKQSTK